MKTKLEPISWRELYKRVIEERDKAKLGEHVHRLEGAMFDRWVHLSRGDQDSDELSEMNRAARCLLILKIHKLGWPPIFPNDDDPTNCALAA